MPRGLEVRPTADRVREALFSSLGSRVHEAQVLDLFAGSGSLGLEALSRGAASVVFVERSAKVQKVLRRNIEDLGFDAQARVIPGDATAALRLLDTEKARFHLVFCDPPYKGPLLSQGLTSIESGNLLADNALIVAEHPKNQPPSVPQGLQISATKTYGATDLSFITAKTDL